MSTTAPDARSASRFVRLPRTPTPSRLGRSTGTVTAGSIPAARSATKRLFLEVIALPFHPKLQGCNFLLLAPLIHSPKQKLQACNFRASREPFLAQPRQMAGPGRANVDLNLRADPIKISQATIAQERKSTSLTYKH